MSHAITFLTKTFLARRAFERFSVFVDPKVILKVAHLPEEFLAVFVTANKELAPL